MSKYDFLTTFDDSEVAALISQAKEMGITARGLAETVYIPMLVTQGVNTILDGLSEREAGLIYDVYCRCYELYGEACPFTEEDFNLQESFPQEGVLVMTFGLPRTHMRPNGWVQMFIVIDAREGKGGMYLGSAELDDEEQVVLYTLNPTSLEWNYQGSAPESTAWRAVAIANALLDVSAPSYRYVKATCPLCQAEFGLGLTEEEADRYQNYLAGSEELEEALPQLNVFEREFLLTGMCPACQCRIFKKELPEDMSRWQQG